MRLKFWKRSAENPSVPLSSPTALADLFGDAFIPTGSGIVVTRKRALEVPAFWAGVQFISNTIASLPLKLYRKDAQGGRQDDSDSPMGRMLARQINGTWSSHKWRKWSMQEVLLEGRSLTWIDRDNLRLKPLNVSASAVRKNNLDEVVFDTEGRSFPSRDVIDIPWMLDDDGMDHVRPLRTHKEALALSIGLNRYASNFFENGGVPPLSLQGPINSEGAADRAANDISQALKRRKNKNILVMPAGHELKQVGFNPEQGQLIEARRMQVEEIARILNLPPMFLQDLTH
ncbi:MAG: phage portal protein, partial [Xanthomonadales bacterium]|nr:phage portal protein [Xanthomonadales bacterium]